MSHIVDYIIVGQGLAGSALAWELTNRGKTVIVFDTPESNRSSAKAAGLFNPITGKVMKKTWQADVIFPFLKKFYLQAKKQLIADFFFQLPMYRPFLSIDEKEQWQKNSTSEAVGKFLLNFYDSPSFTEQVHNPFGGIEIAYSGYLNVTAWTSAMREFLVQRNSYRQEVFQEEELVVDESVQYREWVASKIIFCNGLSAMSTRWFNWLPLIPLKGETLEVSIESKIERIFNRGVYVVPSERGACYKVGSTYQRAPFHESVTEVAATSLQIRLRELISLPFEVVHQDWGIRPTTADRRPLLGAHPSNKNVVIFNGLGTKGVSLAPYFAHQLADWLQGSGDLSADVNIYRFKALYSR